MFLFFYFDILFTFNITETRLNFNFIMIYLYTNTYRIKFLNSNEREVITSLHFKYFFSLSDLVSFSIQIAKKKEFMFFFILKLSKTTTNDGHDE
jgi:hypothetical protein